MPRLPGTPDHRRASARRAQADIIAEALARPRLPDLPDPPSPAAQRAAKRAWDRETLREQRQARRRATGAWIDEIIRDE